MIIDAPPIPQETVRKAMRSPSAARRSRPLLAAACWIYLAALLADWLLMRQAGDRWWMATVLLLAPRWPLALPLLLLWPWALASRKWRLTAPLAAATIIAIGPVMGFCASPPSDERGDLRILTCNVHRQHLDPQQLAVYIAKVQPDVVALQGWSDANREALFADGDWNLHREGELLVASRRAIESVAVLNIADGGDTPKEERGVALLVEIPGPSGPVYLISLHLASPHAGLNSMWQDAGDRLAANVQRRWRESERLRALVDQMPGPLLLAGDFNTTPLSPIFRQHWADFTNAFGDRGLGLGYTYWNDHTQIRIDHILASPEWRITRCWVGPDVGSAHRPLVADVKLR